ncbi:DNA-directed RNA polymerase II subunit RPB1-like isoform 1 [Corchorus olitorius]|uniref:DNA-directed RNA polymerase II subunit RPB1-like isoform 1 n=1 Tax=Corchorus olitorius TaxID=93759 RepID=A0A1R3INX8_9ROSI|nr:DNA-directed RNA polymerase II subunit RPB1-like isoform 1 [Corchorus olitorius]
MRKMECKKKPSFLLSTMSLLVVATTLLLPTAFAARGVSHPFANVRRIIDGPAPCFNLCVWSDVCEDGCECDLNFGQGGGFYGACVRVSGGSYPDFEYDWCCRKD